MRGAGVLRATALVAAAAATVCFAAGCGPGAQSTENDNKQATRRSAYVRFEYVADSEQPSENWKGRTTGSGWLDLDGERVRVTSFNQNAKASEELLSTKELVRWLTIDSHGHTLGSEEDGAQVQRPYSLIRYYEATEAIKGPGGQPALLSVEGTETFTVQLPSAPSVPETTVSVRTSDLLPVRIVMRSDDGATTYTVAARAVEAADVPAAAFVLEFDDKVWPRVSRTLDASEAAALEAPDVYWLGESYEGLPRTEFFYRASQAPGGTISHREGGFPLWAYTSFAKEGVSTAYWRNGDDRAFDTTVTAQGFQGWSTRQPDIKVSSMRVPDVEAWLGLKGDLGDGVKPALRKALGTSEPVEIPTEPYGDPREIMARRMGDTLVIVYSTPGLATRAIKDVRPVAR